MRRLLMPVLLLAFLCACRTAESPYPLNSWTLVRRDDSGARRASAFRYVPDEGGCFLLWGFPGHVTEFYGSPEEPWEDNPEYDLVAFHPDSGRWIDHLPFDKQAEWSKELPPMHLCKSYQGITTGSYRPQLKVREGVLRPDLNIVFEQVTYDSRRHRLIYFTGGRTFAYDLQSRAWSDIAGGQSPPPVSGASLCYVPWQDRVILAGGGHVAEAGPEGRPVGYTGTWAYDCESAAWSRLPGETPPPRLCTRLVCDSKNGVLVMFGGDAQDRYLADTWLLDPVTGSWRESRAAGGPPARAGHFTVYDPASGWVLVGGGYNREELTDLWAFDAARDRWLRLTGEVPTGWQIAADLDPERRLIVLTTAAKAEGDQMGCNEIYPVRSTYVFPLRAEALVDKMAEVAAQTPVPKLSPEELNAGTAPDSARRASQLARLESLPANRWTRLDRPGRQAPLRTWGSCAFDTDRGRLIYWGGGHCGYGGNDYDFYDVAEHTWVSGGGAEFPERAWDKGVNPAGITFRGAPFMRHGRKVYAYDPVSRKVINTKWVMLTAGYDPAPLRDCPPVSPDWGGDPESYPNSSLTKWVTWSFDPDSGAWELLCPAVIGLDLTVSTPYGVMAVDHDWARLDRFERKELVAWEGEAVKENAVWRLDAAARRWEKLSGEGPWPQNLYELTALVHDSKRDRLLLHGGGPNRDELWEFGLEARRWRQLRPRVTGGGAAPVGMREAVYLPDQDLLLTWSHAVGIDQPATWVYDCAADRWSRVELASPEGQDPAVILAQNRAVAYDPARGLVLMVLGEQAGDDVRAVVWALRFDWRAALAPGITPPGV